MHRKNFKKVGNNLSFNTQNADPIFLIIEEKEDGFLYVVETKPFGPVSYVRKDMVEIDEEETVEEEVPAKKGK